MTDKNSEHESDQPEVSRCGYVAIVGRPNVGKSTLLNHILGQKLSITSDKPQTTRQQILGIKTEGADQVIYVDTPGMHDDAQGKALNRFMNKEASQALRHVDLVVFLVDRTKWTMEDDIVLSKLEHLSCPVILAVNKVDQLKDKADLLPKLEEWSAKREFTALLPLSAKRGHNVPELEALVHKYLPEGPHMYDEDQITDRSSRFVVAEIVREKLMRNLGEEVPYGLTVEIEEFSQTSQLLTISALILVEREGQKRIVIGDKGAGLKTIGRDARLDIERMFESKVMLNLWVKVRRGWSDDERALRSLGYRHE